MKHRNLSAFMFAGLLISTAAFADAAADFQKAAELYKAKQFDEAAKIYESLAENANDKQKESIYFNLANSEYRRGQLVPAILNYEKVLHLNPWHADARHNLKAAKQKIQYKIEDKRNAFVHLNELALKWIAIEQWLMGALIFLFLFLLSAAGWLRKPESESFWNFPRTECLTVFTILILLFSARFLYARMYTDAIVLANEADVRYGPDLTNQSLMKLGGGLKVYVVDRREDWSRVLTWNGETGWMKNSDIGLVNE